MYPLGSAPGTFVGLFRSAPMLQEDGSVITYTGGFNEDGKWVNSKPAVSTFAPPTYGGTPASDSPGAGDTSDGTPQDTNKEFWDNVLHYVMLGVPIGAAIGIVMHMMGGKDSSLGANLLGGIAGGALLGGIGAYSGVLGGGKKTDTSTDVATSADGSVVANAS